MLCITSLILKYPTTFKDCLVGHALLSLNCIHIPIHLIVPLRKWSLVAFKILKSSLYYITRPIVYAYIKYTSRVKDREVVLIFSILLILCNFGYGSSQNLISSLSISASDPYRWYVVTHLEIHTQKYTSICTDALLYKEPHRCKDCVFIYFDKWALEFCGKEEKNESGLFFLGFN